MGVVLGPAYHPPPPTTNKWTSEEVEMRQLTTEEKTVKGTKPHKPRTIRVLRQSKFGRVRYCMNGWLFVPAWMRHLDGWSVRVVVILAGLALAFIGAGVVLFWK